MTKFKKKGFTIVELVIVIAVIAILAAVLIPTFSNIIRRAKISADVQLCRNLNTVLANADAEGRIPGSVYDVLYLENEAGYILENLNPTSEGFYYAWDEKNNKIIYIQEDLQTVYYPEDYDLIPNNCWITVGSAEEAEFISGFGYNLSFENDINEEIVLKSVVSINTLGFKAGNVTFNVESSENSVEVAYMVGNFGTVTGDIGSSSVVQSGSATNISLSGNSTSSVTVSGYVNSFSATGVSATVSGSGLVNSVASSSSSTIVNNGVVKSVSEGSNSVVSGKQSGENTVNGNIVPVSTKEGIESVRQQVAAGLRNFKGETIELTNDINMNGIAFQPISSYYRKTSEDVSSDIAKQGVGVWFQGTFDGKGYTIQNFNNNGFAVDGLTFGTNESSVKFGNSPDQYGETIYGIFAAVYNAEIKNLNVTCNIDMTIDHSKHYVGDSIGGIIGFATGDYLKLENCTVSGSVKGYDGVGGLVGRAYVKTITLKNCVNNATVTGVRHTGGLIGFISNLDSGKITGVTGFNTSDISVTFENCFNNGNIINLGWKYDKNTLEAKGVGERNADGYYLAAAAYTGRGIFISADKRTGFTANGDADRITGSIEGFTNNGKVYIAGKECSYLTIDGKDPNWTDLADY